MDPDAALATVRTMVASILESSESLAAIELATAVADLDTWLSRGGFAPTAWRI